MSRAVGRRSERYMRPGELTTWIVLLLAGLTLGLAVGWAVWS